MNIKKPLESKHGQTTKGFLMPIRLSLNLNFLRVSKKKIKVSQSTATTGLAGRRRHLTHKFLS